LHSRSYTAERAEAKQARKNEIISGNRRCDFQRPGDLGLISPTNSIKETKFDFTE
jgi:hypothetical protein